MIARKTNRHAGFELQGKKRDSENHTPKNGVLSTYCHPCKANEVSLLLFVLCCSGSRVIAGVVSVMGTNPSAKPLHLRAVLLPFNFSKVIDHA